MLVYVSIQKMLAGNGEMQDLLKYLKLSLYAHTHVYLENIQKTYVQYTMNVIMYENYTVYMHNTSVSG